LRYFVLDIDAKNIAALVALNRNTVNQYLLLFRKRIGEFRDLQSPFKGEIEVDEYYFGAKRIKGKRGRGACKKTPVFGILKKGCKAYTEVVPDCAKATLQGVIRGRVDPDSVIHSDGWRGYSGLVDLGYKKNYCVNHGSDQFVNRKSHINGIESFWAYAKDRLTKFHGVAEKLFIYI
jgi:transposase-like protein